MCRLPLQRIAINAVINNSDKLDHKKCFCIYQFPNTYFKIIFRVFRQSLLGSPMMMARVW
uniref:Uncharacterized protein n=1 Tax=Anguilla anguilla TaxID=7936 RepID=A0A0E9QNT3_ANGAN